jgi:uncharacterized protein (DUF2267 family)
MINDIHSIQKTIQSSAKLLNKMMDTGEFKSINDAFVILKSSLKALRDRIEIGEAVHLGGQLPTLLRGFYYEGWDYSRKPLNYKTKEDFLLCVSDHLFGHKDLDLSRQVPIALKVILDAIDQGEAVQVLHCLPKELKDLCPE